MLSNISLLLVYHRSFSVTEVMYAGVEVSFSSLIGGHLI